MSVEPFPFLEREWVPRAVVVLSQVPRAAGMSVEERPPEDEEIYKAAKDRMVVEETDTDTEPDEWGLD